MIVHLNNLQATLVSATEDERVWLREYLSFEDQSRKFVRGRDGRVEARAAPRVSLLKGSTFPAGLVGLVRKNGIVKHFNVEVVDKRVRPCEPLDVPLDWLRDYQLEAVDRAVKKTRGILDSPTGSGKTEMAIGIAMRLGKTNTLMITPEADLMHNAARRWEKRVPGVQAGRIGDGHMTPCDGFTAATFQTLASRMKKEPKLRDYLATVGCMIIDEVHTLPADSFYAVAQAIPAYWRIGMSGTPLARGDRKSLFSIASTGAIIYKIEPSLLIERGYISRPRIRMLRVEQEGVAREWRTAYTKFVVESRARNRALVVAAERAAKPGLVFVREKKHGKILVEQIRKAGLRAEFVWGEKNTSQRDEAIRKLEDGELDVIVCSVVFQTGTDIPSLRSLVIGTGGKSEIAALQRVGRGMRRTEDKDEFEVWDIMDAEPKGQGDQTGNKWNARHSRERFRAYAKVGYETTVLDDWT
jgi:superfamily II DNA or RNA helicase